MKKYLLGLALFLAFFPVLAQRDSSGLLPPAVLSDTQIVKFKPKLPPPAFLSATRYADSLAMLPFTTYVVTGEEILRNGYITLADVLKSAPGVRVSQPGNAIDGETFLMRGLPGNQYVKILLNDVPIRTKMASGVSIGAQLPIRQAERIEILYGPASAVYGLDACAGVVNIITKESERPLYTQAALGLGNQGYNNLDLLFGGKLGRGKKIFRFSIYGSNTVREKPALDYDRDDLYDRDKYLPFGMAGGASYLDNPNSVFDGSGNLPKISRLPHESRLFGLQFDWRGIQFSYNRMTRFDHTALGINPLSISLANASNSIGEQLESFSMGFRARIGRLRTINTVSHQRYSLDNFSSAQYLFDQLSAATYEFYEPTTPNWSPYIDTISRLLAFPERYFYARGNDTRIESRVRVQLPARIFWDFGLYFGVFFGDSYTQNLREPLEDEFRSVFWDKMRRGPFFPKEDERYEGSLFSNFMWQHKWLTLMAGASITGTESIDNAGFSPRAAARIRLTKKWQVQASASRGIKDLTPFQAAGRYFLVRSPLTGQNGLERVPYWLGNAELVNSMEAGLVYRGGRSTMSYSFFRQKAFNLIRNGYRVENYPYQPSSSGDEVTLVGMEQMSGLSQSLWGIQASLSNTVPINDLKINEKSIPFFWKNELHIQYMDGREIYGHNIPETNALRNQPRLTVQFRTQWRSGNFEFVMASTRHSSWLSSGVLYRDAYRRSQIQERISGFRTWDILFRLYLSKHFSVNVQFVNAFNRRSAGIDATGTQDDLLWNPQYRRQVRFGINYNLL